MVSRYGFERRCDLFVSTIAVFVWEEISREKSYSALLETRQKFEPGYEVKVEDIVKLCQRQICMMKCSALIQL
jgi:hypothetical protein